MAWMRVKAFLWPHSVSTAYYITCDQAWWDESRLQIGYVSGENGPILPTRDFSQWRPKQKKKQNKKKKLVFFGAFSDIDYISVNKNARKNSTYIQPSLPQAALYQKKMR